MFWLLVLAFLSPLVVGIGVAAALALTTGKRWRTRAIAASAVLGGAALVLLVASIPSMLGAWARVILLLAAFSVLVAGLFLFAEATGLPREVSQIAVSIVVVALVSTVWWAGPMIRDAADQSEAATSFRIAAAVGANPFLVMGYSIFDYEPLHTDGLRPLGLHDYKFERPTWPGASARYALAGLLAFGAGAGVRVLRKRLAP